MWGRDEDGGGMKRVLERGEQCGGEMKVGGDEKGAGER